jgi:SAM-dependent methyltransferase
MSLDYRIMYAVGFTPWENASETNADLLERVFAREEEGQPPHGRALDLGCGSGKHSVTLARRGWDVTGVEQIPKAAAAARERARETNVDVRVVEGDVTKLGETDVGDGYRLVLDFGCFHGLNDDQRAAMARGIEAAAAPDASLLAIAFRAARRLFLPRGADPEDFERALPGWRVTDSDELDMSDAPGPARRAAARIHRLRRV